MRQVTVAQLKALLDMYDDDATITFTYKTPILEVAYGQFEGGDSQDLSIYNIKSDYNKTHVEIEFE